MRVRLSLVGLLAGAMTLACGGGGGGGPPPPPIAGNLDLVLTTPNATDGAILLTVSGGPIDAVVPAGYTTYSSVLTASSQRILLTGNLSNGVIARIHVPDTRNATNYSTTIAQVGSRTTYGLQPLAGYSVAVSP